MIDDLSNAACTIDGKIKPWNDWGYAKNNKDGLYKYFRNQFLDKYPEAKGTFFYPISKHSIFNSNSNYHIYNKPADKDFKKFIHSISDVFEIAYHGTTHGKYIDVNSPVIKDQHIRNWSQEFSYLTLKDIPRIKKEIKKSEDFLEIKITGGKCPGYIMNEYSEDIIEALDFKWWCSSYAMLNKKHKLNRHTYIGKNTKVLDIPTNLYGSRFNFRLYHGQNWKRIPRIIKSYLRTVQAELYIQYLYRNRLPITVQEHFSTLLTDGTRQTPNIFNDILSLEKIYSILRGGDIWYATCGEIAHYLESYDSTNIIKVDNNIFKIEYYGRWNKPFLTVKSVKRSIKNNKTGKIINGVFKSGYWIYNNIETGEYKEL